MADYTIEIETTTGIPYGEQYHGDWMDDRTQQLEPPPELNLRLAVKHDRLPDDPLIFAYTDKYDNQAPIEIFTVKPENRVKQLDISSLTPHQSQNEWLLVISHYQ